MKENIWRGWGRSRGLLGNRINDTRAANIVDVPDEMVTIDEAHTLFSGRRGDGFCACHKVARGNDIARNSLDVELIGKGVRLVGVDIVRWCVAAHLHIGHQLATGFFGIEF